MRGVDMYLSVNRGTDELEWRLLAKHTLLMRWISSAQHMHARRGAMAVRTNSEESGRLHRQIVYRGPLVNHHALCLKRAEPPPTDTSDHR